MLKPFSGEKIVPSKWGPKWRFLGKMGVETLDFRFATPKRHFLARNRVVWRILRQSRCTRLGCSLSQGPAPSPLKNSRVTLSRSCDKWVFLSGRGQGHVSNFYIVDLENFATASRPYTGDIHNTSVVGLFMTPIRQWKRLDRVMVECICLLHIGPL